ncbi:hypothetical protein PR003_g12470 [Phytophthora rubi]|uniref:Uncharacterized protein n=1 Tax=Phytophthora rubi TaxID=129364 RepID=A0A6A3L439_9STRA|nr:hypothetical protein PR001_g15160 [Phytophthora rubi]KAE9028486.1 hypothetical protein PR002_g10386 [Phytophthora rubi]KAE9336517.1 hypothetical protein PR003_g12470 [Phytophthora rubi]
MGDRHLKGALDNARATIGISRSFLKKVWMLRGDVDTLLAPPRSSKLPTHRKLSREEVAQRVLVVPLCQWSTLASLVNAASIAQTTLWGHLKDCALRRVVQRIKSTLTTNYRLWRLFFC